ncbi:MAG: metallophosphoesterase [Deltaproteobacteria bacterium]|jgi:hypothetical protein|nr:metallophosphoesterase [Deltaproteobacteria bacterium]
MIWVIGDIHGMFDPLKRIMTSIRLIERIDEPVERIVFIGDYIDHGPSSKEVIDLILGLEYDRVCLAGNHEDLALRFINGDQKYLRCDGNVWFMNSAIETYESIFDHKSHMGFIYDLKDREYRFKHSEAGRNALNSYKGLRLPRKYEKFLQGLRYSHQEVLGVRGRRTTFSFFHGLPRLSVPVNAQLAGSYKDFTAALNAGPRPGDHRAVPGDGYPERLERSSVWNREYSTRLGYQGHVVVHGHTPTTVYPNYYDNYSMKSLFGQFRAFPGHLFLPFLYSLSQDAGFTGIDAYGQSSRGPGDQVPKSLLEPFGQARLSFHYGCGPDLGLEAINVDTGAVYGGALTALGLSPRYLDHGLMPLLTVRTSGGQRSRDGKIMARSIHVAKFGGRAA